MLLLLLLLLLLLPPQCFYEGALLRSEESFCGDLVETVRERRFVAAPKHWQWKSKVSEGMVCDVTVCRCENDAACFLQVQRSGTRRHAGVGQHSQPRELRAVRRCPTGENT